VGVGKHVVAATAAGYEPGEAKIEIAGEDRKVVDLKLVPRPAQPFVAAAPVPAPVPVSAPTSVPVPAPAPNMLSTSARWAQPAPGTSLVPPQGEVAASAESSRWSGLRTAGIVAASVGVAGLVTGGILWEVAKDKNSEANNQLPSSYGQARSTRSQAEDLTTGANACLIAGGVLAGIGVITTLLSFIDDSPPKSVALAPTMGPNFAGLTMKGIW
jgi:hypothetical protein